MQVLIGDKEFGALTVSINYHKSKCNIDMRLEDNSTPLDELDTEITTHFDKTITINNTVYNINNFASLNRYYNGSDIITNAFFNDDEVSETNIGE